LHRQQDILVGAPCPESSTDIYDGFVSKEISRKEGSVFFIDGIESRKPPRIAPNWRTTYRLSVSALVAVIRLSVSKDPLSRSDAIEWGEIVAIDPKAGALGDSSYRAKGKLAVRLLTNGDCSGMLNESHLEVGSRVAVIDLRVFVPEVISVLATFADDLFLSHLSQIPQPTC
jgi:hypothetical protein